MESNYLRDNAANRNISVLTKGHTSLLDKPKDSVFSKPVPNMCLTLSRFLDTASLIKTLLFLETFPKKSSQA